MKNIIKSFLALIVLFVSAPGLFGQIAPDVYKEDPDHPGFVYSKEVEGPNNKGEYTIYLKSFMTGTVSESVKRIPSEIILVLDVSGSMRFSMSGSQYSDWDASRTDTRMYALKQAVNQFITDIKTDATTNNVNNRIAIVKFAGDKYYTGSGQDSDVVTGNHKYYETTEWNGRQWVTTTHWLEAGDSNFNSQDRYNATEIVMGFTSVTSGEQDLKNAINGLVPGGATAADFGVYKARALMRTLFNNPTSNNPTPKEVTNKMIVFFTDGEPNHQSGFDKDVAETAIGTMRPMKGWTAFDDEETGASGKTKVYTIGTFGGTPSDNVTTYMNRVSSNYPNATGMDAGEAGSGSATGYYILANNAQDLVNAFGKISSDVARPAFIIKNNASSVVDIVAKSYALPTGSSASDVKVYTTPCTGKTTGTNQYTFSRTISEWNELDPDEVGLDVDTEAGVITVENYNFTDSDNIVALKTDGTTYQGNQLIIEIPIIMNPNAVGGQSIQTNAPGSGLRYIDENNQEQTISFETPNIHLPINLEIQKRGLNEGESAKFTIQRKWSGKDSDRPADIDANTWYDYTSVFVTRREASQTGDNSPSVFIVGLDPNYLYKIKEDEWSWSYSVSDVYGFNNVDGQENPVRYDFEDVNDVTSDKLNLNPFIFVNERADDIDRKVRHAESIVTNEFRLAGSSEATAGQTKNSKD